MSDVGAGGRKRGADREAAVGGNGASILRAEGSLDEARVHDVFADPRCSSRFCSPSAAVPAAATWPTPSTQRRFGVRMAKMNLWREAMFRFRRATQIEPDNAMAHNNLAVAYEATGDFEPRRRSIARPCASTAPTSTSRRTTAASWSSCSAARSAKRNRRSPPLHRPPATTDDRRRRLRHRRPLRPPPTTTTNPPQEGAR